MSKNNKINDAGYEVPDNKIVLIPHDDIPVERLPNLISSLKNEKTRDWFSKEFYRCLPLTIGNQYGFIIKSEYSFTAMWDGGIGTDATKFSFDMPVEETRNFFPAIKSHFGHGIITIDAAFSIRTPPGINIMTINPPNYVIPNVTVMTGVVEADNLRYTFTFNLKLQDPNVAVHFPAGSPLAAFIPIPRYFADSFDILLGSDYFSEEIIKNEKEAAKLFGDNREKLKEEKPNQPWDKLYMKGLDIYGDKFLDHQRP